MRKHSQQMRQAIPSCSKTVETTVPSCTKIAVEAIRFCSYRRKEGPSCTNLPSFQTQRWSPYDIIPVQHVNQTREKKQSRNKSKSTVLTARPYYKELHNKNTSASNRLVKAKELVSRQTWNQKGAGSKETKKGEENDGLWIKGDRPERW